VKLARRDHWRREKLQNLIAHFRQTALFRDLPLLPSTGPIQPLMCGDEKRALALATALEAQGFWVPAIRPPTVPDGRARLRITLSSLHTQAEVDGLIDALSWARDAVEMGFGAAGAAVA
jgi:8-amino-7-oxononanoate synthase